MFTQFNDSDMIDTHKKKIIVKHFDKMKCNEKIDGMQDFHLTYLIENTWKILF